MLHMQRKGEYATSNRCDITTTPLAQQAHLNPRQTTEAKKLT